MTTTVPAAMASGRAARASLLVALVALSAAAWFWLLPMHMAPTNVLRTDMAMPMRWNRETILFVFVMWSVMMAAMMIPSALPMIAVRERIARRRAAAHPAFATIAFVVGYLVVWIGFSAAATTAQWWLGRAGYMSGMMASANALLSGALLVAAGLYQWSPVKHVCLRKCRSPFGFVLNEQRSGVRGALASGIRHGAFCVGCCWALMALLFVFGTMNLLAAAALAMLVLAEKALPHGDFVARAAGGLLAAWGTWMIAGVIAA